MEKSGAMNESKIQQLRATVLKDLNELIPKNHYTFVRTQQDIAGQDFLLAKLLISSHYRNPQLSSRQLTAASLLEKIGLYCSEYESPDLKSDVDVGITPEYIKQQEQENLCAAIEEYRIHLSKKEAKILTRFLIPATAPAAEVKAKALPANVPVAEVKAEAVPVSRKIGRPKSIEGKAAILRQIIELLTEDKRINPIELPGSAKDLQDACGRISQSKSRKNQFITTPETFKNWLKEAGFGFGSGRTKNNEKSYWTTLSVEKLHKLPREIFTEVSD